MDTFMAKESAVERKWYVVDAAGKALGRVAVPKWRKFYVVNTNPFLPRIWIPVIMLLLSMLR